MVRYVQCGVASRNHLIVFTTGIGGPELYIIYDFTYSFSALLIEFSGSISAFT